MQVMKMDENVASGIEKLKEHFGSNDETNPGSLTVNTKEEEKVLTQSSPMISSSISQMSRNKSPITPTPDGEGSKSNVAFPDVGRVKGWKEKLDVMRKEK